MKHDRSRAAKPTQTWEQRRLRYLHQTGRHAEFAAEQAATRKRAIRAASLARMARKAVREITRP